jgi:hypothetical protein
VRAGRCYLLEGEGLDFLRRVAQVGRAAPMEAEVYRSWSAPPAAVGRWRNG